jgi:hypothetical protein
MGELEGHLFVIEGPERSKDLILDHFHLMLLCQLTSFYCFVFLCHSETKRGNIKKVVSDSCVLNLSDCQACFSAWGPTVIYLPPK